MAKKNIKYLLQIKNKFTKNKWYGGNPTTYLYNQKRQADRNAKRLDGYSLVESNYDNVTQI